MKKLFKMWLSSISYVCSLLFLRTTAQALVKSLPCIGLSLGIFALLGAISYCHIAYISLFMQQIIFLIPPLVAMMASPFYVPFLVSSVAGSQEDSAINWWASVWWSCLMYGVIAGTFAVLYWVCTEGTVELLLGMVAVLALLSPFIILKLFAFPIATAAAIFAPMSHRSSTELWRHARRMTLGELPGILLLFAVTLPLSYGSYCLAGLLLHKKLIIVQDAYLILHAVNILSWEIGWVAFMVFYQQRKKAYIS